MADTQQHRGGSTEPEGRGRGADIVIGLGLILLGIVLVLERTGVVDARTLLQFWPLLLVLVGAGLVVQAIWGGQGGSAGGLGGVWVVLLVIALVSWQAQRRTDGFVETHGDTVSVIAVMGRDEVSSLSTGLRRADMATLMGRSHLDLREAMPALDGEVVVDVFGLMGLTVVQVPPGWAIDVRAQPVLGRVRDLRDVPAEELDRPPARGRDRGRRRDDRGVLWGATTLAPLEPPGEGEAAPRIVIRGVIMMGELVIRS
jgi:hypothetical protein